MIIYKFTNVFVTVKNPRPGRADLVKKVPSFFRRYDSHEVMALSAKQELCERFNALSVEYSVEALPASHTSEYAKAILDAYKWVLTYDVLGDGIILNVTGTKRYDPLDYISAPISISYTYVTESEFYDEWREVDALGALLMFNIYNSSLADPLDDVPPKFKSGWSCGAVYWVHPDDGIKDEILEDYKAVKVRVTEAAAKLIKKLYKGS